jgi:hypothetical protein
LKYLKLRLYNIINNLDEEGWADVDTHHAYAAMTNQPVCVLSINYATNQIVYSWNWPVPHQALPGYRVDLHDSRILFMVQTNRNHFRTIKPL